MSCSELLKYTANSQVLLLLSILDLWLRNPFLNSVEVRPTYCILHKFWRIEYWWSVAELWNLEGWSKKTLRLHLLLHIKQPLSSPVWLYTPLSTKTRYREIPKISPGAYTFQRPFLRGLFLEGLIFGGAYRWIIIDWASHIGCFALSVWGLYLEGLIFGILWYMFFFFGRKLGQSIQGICSRVARRFGDLNEWLFAVPLVHFLTQTSEPFNNAVLLMEEPKNSDVTWWGATGFETKSVREKKFAEDRYPALNKIL